MALSSDKALIYLTGKSVQVLFPQRKINLSYTFPTETVLYGEIVNEKLLREKLTEFFNIPSLKGKAVIVLSNDLIFGGTTQDKEGKKEIVEQFLNYVPLNHTAMAKHIVETDKMLYVFATNSTFYILVKSIVESYGLEILSVVPLAVFINQPQVASITEQQALEILQQDHALQMYSFLSDNNLAQNNHAVPANQSVSQPIEKKENSNKQYVFLAVVFLIFLVSLFVALTNFGVV